MQERALIHTWWTTSNPGKRFYNCRSKSCSFLEL